LDPGGQPRRRAHPRFDKHTDQRGRKRSSEVHQVRHLGGRLTDDGLAVTFADLPGFAEEARQNW
jgi:hypothetical protein